MKLQHFVLFTLLIFCFSCSKRGIIYYESIDCDCENTDNSKFTSVCGNYKFASGKYKTSEKSHSGKYSVLTNKGNPYALEYVIENVKKGEFYKISVWSYSEDKKVSLAATSGEPIFFSITNRPSVFIESTGWELLTLEFEITEELNNKNIKVFVWNLSETKAFFDDLQIVKYPAKGEFGINDQFLEINIDSINYEKLLTNRNIALSDGVITKNDSSWIAATMKYGKKDYKIDLRLKGDWVDHLYSEKWSFRIKIKKGKNFKGFKVFSIHAPEARNFLSEWVAHQFFEEEDVLTTRYGFVPVKLNGKSLGIYAYEEHFEKQLIESSKRREGPILKYSEDLMWKVTKENQKNNNIYSSLPFFKASQIMAFKISEILLNDNIKTQFQIAQNLLFQHKNQMAKISDLFEYDKLARFYALADLFKLDHGCYTWHNLRFYYNPVLSKLEPIMFDGYADSKTLHWLILPYIGAYYNLYSVADARMQQILHPISDKKFRDLYRQYLVKYTDSLFIDSVFNKININYNANLNLIQKEYPFYYYNKQSIYKNAKIIRDSLNIFLQNEEYYNTIHDSDFPSINTKNDTLPEMVEFIPYYVSVFLESNKNDNYEFAINNFYFKSINLLGFGKTENNILVKLNKVINSSNEKTKSNKLNIKSNDTLNYIFVKPESKDTIIAIKINKWNMPFKHSPRQELEKLNENTFQEFFSQSNNTLILKSKKIIINKNVIIPDGYNVEIADGSEIDILNNALFISYSPIKINGLADNPVIIKSSDKSANGFSIFQAKGKSFLNYVEFDGLNTLNYYGWTLTGAVNFYESDVEITNSSFINNVCEDGLNIIRSNFLVKDSRFENTYGDAFDSDFSNGKVINCRFNNLNNDAIDFSGSVADITSCIISNAKDKGVSGGEKSKMQIKNLTISSCNIGIASKDKSELIVENTSIKSSNYGFVLLQKKPEYGDAKVEATNIILENNKSDYLIEKGSEFSLNGKEIVGTEKKLAKQFYN